MEYSFLLNGIYFKLQLIMRSQEDIYDLCNASNVPRDAITIRKEDTNLTYLIQIGWGNSALYMQYIKEMDYNSHNL